LYKKDAPNFKLYTFFLSFFLSQNPKHTSPKKSVRQFLTERNDGFAHLPTYLPLAQQQPLKSQLSYQNIKTLRKFPSFLSMYPDSLVSPDK
jgi:hypothetical protein